MSKVTWNGGALVAPVPAVMVSCGSMENSNIITIGWTGIINTDPPKTYISVRPKRHSYNIIKECGEFVINLTPSSLAKQADYCGIYTGAKTDKFQKCGFDKEKATKVSCPIIKQSPLSLECKVTDIIPLGTHDMFIADIVAVDVDEALIDKTGKLHLDKAELCAYVHGEYFELGKKLGHIGFSTDKNAKTSINTKSASSKALKADSFEKGKQSSKEQIDQKDKIPNTDMLSNGSNKAGKDNARKGKIGKSKVEKSSAENSNTQNSKADKANAKNIKVYKDKNGKAQNSNAANDMEKSFRLSGEKQKADRKPNDRQHKNQHRKSASQKAK